MDEQHYKTTFVLEFISFLNTLYGQVSGNNSEVDIELSIFVSWIATI